MWANPQENTDLVILTEEMFCAVSSLNEVWQEKFEMFEKFDCFQV